MRVDAWTEEEFEILKNYWGKIKIEKICQLLPRRTRSTIYKNAWKLQLKGNSSLAHRIYSLNENFFEIPNILNSFYAGWIAADGCICKHSENKISIQICIQHKDIDLISDFQKNIDWGGNLYLGDNNRGIGKNAQKVIRMSVCSKKLSEDLQKNFNITSRKTFTLGAPNLTNKDLILAYIAGYIIGDGGFSLRKLNGKLTPQLYVCGNYDFLVWLKQQLDIYFPSNQLSSLTKNHSIYQWSTTGKRATEILRYLYQLPTPKLQRKWTSELISYILT